MRGHAAHYNMPDKRVTPLTLDVTNASQIQQAVDEVGTLDVLINNAGIAIYDDLSNLDVIEQHLAVNFLGMLRVTRAFLPLLRRSKGAIVNNLSLVALAALPVIPAYSISKAAAFNMTQSLRALLARSRGDGPWRRPGPHRHRHEPRLRDTEGFAGVCGAGHLRRVGDTAKRKSFPIPRPSPSPRAGALAQSRRSSVSSQRFVPESAANLGMTSLSVATESEGEKTMN